MRGMNGGGVTSGDVSATRVDLPFPLLRLSIERFSEVPREVERGARGMRFLPGAPPRKDLLQASLGALNLPPQRPIPGAPLKHLGKYSHESAQKGVLRKGRSARVLTREMIHLTDILSSCGVVAKIKGSRPYCSPIVTFYLVSEICRQALREVDPQGRCRRWYKTNLARTPTGCNYDLIPSTLVQSSTLTLRHSGFPRHIKVQ